MVPATFFKELKGMNKYQCTFLVGAPGSGKDFILRTALKESNATEIPLSKLITHIREQSDYPEVDGRPIIVNGNADQDIEQCKAVLEVMGYTTAMVFVYTTNEASQKRSSIPEEKRCQKYQVSIKNMHSYKDIFEGFFLIDNTNDFITCNEETQTQMVLWLKELSESVESFFESKTAHYNAMGFKVARETKPVGGEPKGGHSVPAGYERVKDGSFYKLRKKSPVPLTNQDDTQTDGTGLKEDLDMLFEKEYPTIIDMIAQKKPRKGESQGDKYKGGIAVAGDKATQRTTGTGQAESIEYVEEDMAKADSTRQEVVVPQTQAKGVKYSKNRPAKGANPPGTPYDSKFGAVPSSSAGITSYKVDEYQPTGKTINELRKK